MPIIGDTESEAKAQLDTLQGWLSPTNALSLVSVRLGHDISGYPLDGPIPDLPSTTDRGQAFAQTLLDHGAAPKHDTARPLQHHRRRARPLGDLRHRDAHRRHFRGVVRSGLADGFIIMPAYFPGAFNDFVDIVVPELQRRGLYRKEYSGPTLRGHLGQARAAGDDSAARARRLSFVIAKT